MNGLTLIALIAIAVGVYVAYRVGVLHGRRALPGAGIGAALRPETPAASTPTVSEQPPTTPSASTAPNEHDRLDAERFRLILGQEAEAQSLRGELGTRQAEAAWLRALEAERTRLYGELADARAEAARYRQIVVDIENNAPPPLLESPTAPDDLKLIVGVGPVLERMLQQLGVSTYRQIARWTERDIDDFDARLHEFPGRIRRDDWVTQARALHHSKYGDSAVSRERS